MKLLNTFFMLILLVGFSDVSIAAAAAGSLKVTDKVVLTGLAAKLSYEKNPQEALNNDIYYTPLLRAGYTTVYTAKQLFEEKGLGTAGVLNVGDIDPTWEKDHDAKMKVIKEDREAYRGIHREIIRRNNELRAEYYRALDRSIERGALAPRRPVLEKAPTRDTVDYYERIAVLPMNFHTLEDMQSSIEDLKKPDGRVMSNIKSLAGWGRWAGYEINPEMVEEQARPILDNLASFFLSLSHKADKEIPSHAILIVGAGKEPIIAYRGTADLDDVIADLGIGGLLLESSRLHREGMDYVKRALKKDFKKLIEATANPGENTVSPEQLESILTLRNILLSVIYPETYTTRTWVELFAKNLALGIISSSGIDMESMLIYILDVSSASFIHRLMALKIFRNLAYEKAEEEGHSVEKVYETGHSLGGGFVNALQYLEPKPNVEILAFNAPNVKPSLAKAAGQWRLARSGLGLTSFCRTRPIDPYISEATTWTGIVRHDKIRYICSDATQSPADYNKQVTVYTHTAEDYDPRGSGRGIEPVSGFKYTDNPEKRLGNYVFVPSTFDISDRLIYLHLMVPFANNLMFGLDSTGVEPLYGKTLLSVESDDDIAADQIDAQKKVIKDFYGPEGRSREDRDRDSEEDYVNRLNPKIAQEIIMGINTNIWTHLGEIFKSRGGGFPLEGKLIYKTLNSSPIEQLHQAVNNINDLKEQAGKVKRVFDSALMRELAVAKVEYSSDGIAVDYKSTFDAAYDLFDTHFFNYGGLLTRTHATYADRTPDIIKNAIPHNLTLAELRGFAATILDDLREPGKPDAKVILNDLINIWAKINAARADRGDLILTKNTSWLGGKKYTYAFPEDPIKTDWETRLDDLIPTEAWKTFIGREKFGTFPELKAYKDEYLRKSEEAEKELLGEAYLNLSPREKPKADSSAASSGASAAAAAAAPARAPVVSVTKIETGAAAAAAERLEAGDLITELTLKSGKEVQLRRIGRTYNVNITFLPNWAVTLDLEAQTMKIFYEENLMYTAERPA